MQFIPKDILHKSYTFLFLTLSIFTSSVLPQSIDQSLRSITIENIQKDDIRGEDLTIRKAAIEALGDRAGTVVVMSPQSGRIYTIVNQDWGIRRGFKPCSTIKLVSGIAAYSEKLINGNGTLTNDNFRLSLDESLAYSNNSFFQKAGADLGNRTFIDYARRLGLGERTGINATGEYAGKLPFGNENLRIYSHADDFEVSPLQLAVLVSAITNGGDLVVPQIPRVDYSNAGFRGFYKRRLDIKPTVYERVIPGMIGAVKYGTAKGIDPTNLKIAGKTGSCISDGTWVGLFTSVAPIIDPKFAVVVITEGKYARGSHAAAIAGKIYRILGKRFGQTYKGKLSRMTVMQGPKNRSAIMSPRPQKTVLVAPVNSPESVSGKTNTKASKTNAKVRDSREIGDTLKRSKKKKESVSTTVVVGGKTEITRPRIVRN
ncbi:MAG: hypothetical protein KDB79_01885 [Acidobacteria bacterium]|nr:hypothetical protein [Acidobacteriota bacterium]